MENINKHENEHSNSINDYDKMSFSARGIIEGFNIAIHKMDYKFWRQVLFGIMGGAILALAYIACIYASIGVTSTGIKNLINGIIFPAGIILITFLGGGLFTSHVVAAIPTFKKCVRVNKFLSAISGVFLGNFIGTLIIAVICEISGIFENKDFATAVIALGEHKMYDVGESVINGEVIKTNKILVSMLYCFGSGILCNMLVSATIPATGSSKSDVAKIGLMFLLILLFIVSGFQHSPANTFVFWSLLFESINHKQGIISNTISMNSSFYFIFVNILCCLIGNFIGGGILTPGVITLINKEQTKIYFEMNKLTK